MATKMEPRGYQKQILEMTEIFTSKNTNVLIELDCGLGKRFLQYSFIQDKFRNNKILLVLQSSTSLYETYNYLEEHTTKSEIKLIDSRVPSKIRGKILKDTQVVLTLPQTLSNTLEKVPDALDSFEYILINEVDQIIRRRSMGRSFKQPYPKLMPVFKKRIIIGMSGTLRDNHYVLDKQQMEIKKELKSLLEVMGKGTQLLTMDMLRGSDVEDHISESDIIPTGVVDDSISLISIELQHHIKDAKKKLLDFIKEDNPELYHDVKNDYTKLFGPLPVPPKLAQNFHRGYLVRKYLWAQPGESAYRHLVQYGMDEEYVKSTLPWVPNKFFAIRKFVKESPKTVILCSFLDTVDLVQQTVEAMGIASIKITGQVPQHQRAEDLQKFRNSDKQMVAVLSNVGERDLDIPEANLLIVFDLVRTTKTVYQKLKRTRGGICRLLYYDDTREQQKVSSVIEKIGEKYNWSTNILSHEKINIST